jgi:chromosomal replication initiator protein
MTRLNSALIVDIQHPDLETRIAILKKKALEKDIYLDDQIINLIANSVKSSVRELEGKLVKLGAYSDLMNVDIDIEIAKQQLNLENINNEKLINADSITKSVSNYFSLPVGDIRGKTRKKEITLARHIAMYMIHKFAKITLEDIGKYFDGRDHSTVIHGIKKINDMIKQDSRVSQQIYEIETKLQ